MNQAFRMMMLGVGNGFVKSTYHNNALLECNRRRYLIDCGALAWHSLYELGLRFEDIDGIFITHLHYDHCGGLDEAALYGVYAAGRKMKLWLPAPLQHTLWEQHLRGTLENVADGKTSLEDYFDIQTVEEGEPFWLTTDRSADGVGVGVGVGDREASDGTGTEAERPPLSMRWMSTSHVPSKFSCSLVIDNRLFYSADMVADADLMMRVHQEGITDFYHDCSFDSSPVHASFEALCQYPAAIRQHTYLMHYGEAPRELGEDALCGMKLLRQHEWRTWS
ncbi:MBL fold metallo-hydrolase [Paenibacillus paeoniae]|uniref:MBL fold metallo-hydrolase n=1 Tax=Paenibacillus paeoniae TaxID=2292705 RepID=A0A371PH58_9BACL|nr:MBL fold metallo-hydrolase [Paenibacillus paeoniae]REK75560.1 MBL fold metallo-hydrolase [Paenibacillus paeoniae]